MLGLLRCRRATAGCLKHMAIAAAGKEMAGKGKEMAHPTVSAGQSCCFCLCQWHLLFLSDPTLAGFSRRQANITIVLLRQKKETTNCRHALGGCARLQLGDGKCGGVAWKAS